MLKLKEVKIPKVDKKSEQITTEPEMIRFAGFEVGKLNVVKMKIVNKGTQSQKIQIVPPRTNFFSVKYDQRGAIGPQLTMELYITLKPFEYKYYEDTLKINTFTETIVVPILAFPAINRDYLRDLFPRYLDFGTLDLGEQFSQRFIIQNKVPINFEFEFIIIKDNIDFRITPIRGIIPDKGVTEIEIMYRPTINVTVYMEVELMIGQNFEPLPIKLMGTGRSLDKSPIKIRRPASVRKLNSIVQPPPKQQTQQQKQVQKDLQSSQDNIDEYSIPEQSPQIIYEATGEVNEQVEQFYPIIKTTRRKIAQLSEIVEIKQGVGASGRQAKEKQYLERFNMIANLDKEKENKLRQFIGDSPIENQTISEILNQREQFNQQMLKDIEQNGLTRYQLELDNDNAVADQILPKYEFLKLKKFVYAVTRVIYRIRFDNRISKIRAFLKGAVTKTEVEKLVNQDWQKAEYAGVGKKDIIQFVFEFEENCIGKFALPVQYQETNTYSFKFDINPRTGFDDWAPIEQIPQSDQEVMQYKNWDYPQLVYHPPLLQQVVFRDGAEEEKALKGKMGPINNILSLKNEDILRTYMLKPPENEGQLPLLPHRTLKFLLNLDTTNSTETTYLLNYRQINNIGADLDTQEQVISQQEISNHQPGYNNLNLLYELKLDQFYYQERNMQLAYDFGFEEQIEQYCVPLLHDIEPDDYITDDSDEERPPLPIVVDYNEWLNRIEQDDKQLQQFKQGEIIDQQEQLKNKIDMNLMFEKNKWISTVPSKTNDYNKFIIKNEHKMVIL